MQSTLAGLAQGVIGACVGVVRKWHDRTVSGLELGCVKQQVCLVAAGKKEEGKTQEEL